MSDGWFLVEKTIYLRISIIFSMVLVLCSSVSNLNDFGLNRKAFYNRPAKYFFTIKSIFYHIHLKFACTPKSGMFGTDISIVSAETEKKPNTFVHAIFVRYIHTADFCKNV